MRLRLLSSLESAYEISADTSAITYRYFIQTGNQNISGNGSCVGSISPLAIKTEFASMEAGKISLFVYDSDSGTGMSETQLVALVLADAWLEKFGGDSMREIKTRWETKKNRRKDRGHPRPSCRRSPATGGPGSPRQATEAMRPHCRSPPPDRRRKKG